MFRLLKFLFGPRLGRVRMHGASVTLYNIDAGVLHVIEPDDSWAGNVKEWSNGKFRLVHPGLRKETRRPIERFTISYEIEGLRKMAVQPEPFSWEAENEEFNRQDCRAINCY